MAAPVQRDEELELRVDSLAYGGNGVARTVSPGNPARTNTTNPSSRATPFPP